MNTYTRFLQHESQHRPDTRLAPARPPGLLVKRTSLLARLVCRLPSWLMQIESARVGSDTKTYVRISWYFCNPFKR